MANSVEKKDIDWTSLGFAYTQCDYSYVAHYKDGAWDEGGLTTNHSISLITSQNDTAPKPTETHSSLRYCSDNGDSP